MKKALFFSFFYFFGIFAIAQEIPTDDVNYQIQLGYRFQENVRLYNIGIGFDIPINSTNSQLLFSGLFETNFMFGKNDDNNIYGVNAIPGLRMNVKRGDLFLKFDLLSGIASFKNENIADQFYGNFSEVRFGIGYKMIQVDFSTAVFLGNGFALAKPLYGIFVRYSF